jgi:hypothetical protein
MAYVLALNGLAATGIARPDWQLAADRFAAMAGEDWRPVVKHPHYYRLLLTLAESHLTRRLFGTMVRRIAALPAPAG